MPRVIFSGIRKPASAIVLAVESPFPTEPHRGEPTVVFFEIRGEIAHSRPLRHAGADVVDEGSVLARTDREGGGECVVLPAVQGGKLRRLAEAQTETRGASRAPFPESLHARGDGKELRRILFRDDEFDIGKMRKKAL